MKEYIINKRLQKVAKNLEKVVKSNLVKKASFKDFVDAYMEAMFWASIDDEGNPLDSEYTFGDLSLEAKDKIYKDCSNFLNNAGELVEDNLTQAGHDFWLTRNHHGAGFWDGDWPEDVGNKLTELSEKFGEQNLVVGDDGLLYLE